MAGRNQGEGDRESARRYNKDAQKFARSGKSAGETRRDPEAERKGRSRAKEVDPGVHRNYSKPQR